MSEDRPELGLLSLEGVADSVDVADPRDTELGLMRELGKSLVNYLFMALRTLSIHSADNDAVNEPLRRLAEALQELSTVIHRTHFITVEGQVYLNDLRIKTEPSAYNNLAYLVGQLDRHGIGGITFHKPPDTATIKALLLLILNTRPPKEGDALDAIRLVLAASEVHDIEFDRPYYFKSGDGQVAVQMEGEAGDQEVAALSYAKGVLAVKDYFRAVEAAETANPLRIRKIMHDLVDLAEEDPRDFLKLHTIHGVEDPYYNHCTNVAALSVAVGRELGLGRVDLAELGSAAMFHDLGYAAVERWSEQEGRETTEDERMREHPIAGFRTLLKQGEYGPGLLRRMLVTLEHHMHFRRPGGYPHLGKKRLSVFTRIVQVADYYDALVTPMGESRPMLPVRALEKIVGNKGAVFDPLCVKALVNVVGRYPYGSLVRLSSGEVGVVTSGGRSADAFSKPIVMIVRNADGSETAPREVDLLEDRVLRRRIAVVLDPFTEDITPHAVLFDRLDGAPEEAAGPTEAAAALAADEWTRALWAGEDAEAMLAGPGGGPELPAATEEADTDEAPPPPPPPFPWEDDDPALAADPAGSSWEAESPTPARPFAWEDDDLGEAPERDATPPGQPAPVEEAPPPRRPPPIDPWGFGAVMDHREGLLDVADDAGFARDDLDHVRAEVSPLTDRWDAEESASTLAGGTGGGASASEEAPAAAGDGPASPTTTPPSTPGGSAKSRTQETTAVHGPSDEAPPTNLTPDEIAERKAAWAKAMREAYARGGEAAVRSLASKTWYNFDRDP
jgi:HD-GYP domain-containing protein (c-di-GMP phosphodiesterase class II)